MRRKKGIAYSALKEESSELNLSSLASNSMAKLIASEHFVFWIAVLIITWTRLNYGQRLYDVRQTCPGQEEMSFLKKELTLWQKMVKDQATKIEILEENLNSVNKKLSIYIENRLVRISNAISKIESKQNLQQRTMQRFETRQSVLERKIDSRIAFTAQIVFNVSISNLKKYQKLVFGHVVTNQGNAYDKETGIFRCPKNGLYVFYYNINTLQDKYALVELTKNGDGYYAIAFSGDHPSASTSASTFVVLSLVKGDRIWLRASKDCSTGEVIKYQQNTFSGFLLHAY